MPSIQSIQKDMRNPLEMSAYHTHTAAYQANIYFSMHYVIMLGFIETVKINTKKWAENVCTTKSTNKFRVVLTIVLSYQVLLSVSRIESYTSKKGKSVQSWWWWRTWLHASWMEEQIQIVLCLIKSYHLSRWFLIPTSPQKFVFLKKLHKSIAT